ncbi:MAG: hypothetical protein EBT09_06350, partial [Actinobacteria bacterium]|nr:hypothetical protein [Actinomycetota bacterium]
QTGFTVDNAGPSVTIGYQSVADTDSTLPDGDYTPSLPKPVRDSRRVAFQIVAADAAAITGSPTVSVRPSLDGALDAGTVTVVTLQEATTVPGKRVWRGSYDVPHGTVANDGIANVTLGIGGIKDVAGNDATSTGQSLTFVIDSTPPTVTIGYQSIADGTSPQEDSVYRSSLAVPVRGDRSVAIQVTVAEAGGFSGAVSGAPVVSVQPAGATVPVPVTLTQTATGSKVWRGVYDAPANGSNGGATISLVSTGVTDEAGNVATVGAAQVTSFEIDNIKPSAAILFHRLAKGGLIPTTTYEYDDPLARPVNGTQDLAIEVEVTEAGGGGTVTGAPSLTITANSVATPIALTETSAGSKLWHGRYASIPADGDYTATIALDISGVSDRAGNSAEISAGQKTTFLVDNTKPDVTVTYRIGETGAFEAAPRAVRVADGTVTVKAVFANTTSLYATPTFQLATGIFTVNTAIQEMTETADPLIWIFPITVPSEGDGGITATVRGQDPAGNVVENTHQALTVDNSLPTVVKIERAGASSVLTDATGPAFTVTFSEEVQNVTTSSFKAIKGSEIAGTVPTVATVSGSGATYTFTLGSIAGLTGDYANGTRVGATLGLALDAPGVTDRAGNPLSTTLPAPTTAANQTYSIDNAVPTFAVTYSRSGPLKAGPLTITATSSEPLPAVPTIFIDQQGTTAINPAAPMSGTAGGTVFTYGYTVGVADGASYKDGAATVRVFGTDYHTNRTPEGTTPTSGGTFEIDTTAPTFAITYSRIPPLKAGAVTVTVTANEALSAAPTISIDQPGTTDISSASTSGSGPYTYAYTVVLANVGTYVDGTATVTVSGTDIAGNTGTTITSGGTFVIDTTPPTVALTYSPNRAVKAGDVVTVTATFSEAMASAPTIAIAVPSGGTNAVTATAMTSTSSSVWNYAYTVGTGNGTATVTIAGTDVALNANASATNATFTVDNISPTVSGVSSTLADGSYKAGQAVPVTVTFSEPVTVTGTPQLTLATGTPSTTAVNYTSGSGTTVLTFTYTVAAGNTSADLDYAATTSLALNGGTIRDAAG